MEQKINGIDAVIDVGSNSVRLMVSKDGRTLFKISDSTRLSEDFFEDCLIKPVQLERTAQAVKNFYIKAVTFGADGVYVFATACVRKARNRELLLNRIEELTGLKTDVISGEEEAVLGATGALCGKDGGIIDVGGASTEISVFSNGKCVYAKSLFVGAVTLFERFRDDKEKVFSYLNELVKEYGEVPKTNFIGVGGTITSVASVLQGLQIYEPDKINGYKISAQAVKSLSDRLFSMTAEEREKIVGLQKRRAKIFASGVAIVLSITEYLGADFISASDSDNTEGYLIKVKNYEKKH